MFWNREIQRHWRPIACADRTATLLALARAYP